MQVQVPQHQEEPDVERRTCSVQDPLQELLHTQGPGLHRNLFDRDSKNTGTGIQTQFL